MEHFDPSSQEVLVKSINLLVQYVVLQSPSLSSAYVELIITQEFMLHHCYNLTDSDLFCVCMPFAKKKDVVNLSHNHVKFTKVFLFYQIHRNISDMFLG